LFMCNSVSKFKEESAKRLERDYGEERRRFCRQM
jgi:hypothetical protein